MRIPGMQSLLSFKSPVKNKGFMQSEFPQKSQLILFDRKVLRFYNTMSCHMPHGMFAFSLYKHYNICAIAMSFLQWPNSCGSKI